MPSREHFLTFKIAKNKRTSGNKKTKKHYFEKDFEFWKKLKPFLKNKERFSENEISTEINDQLVSNEKIFILIFNKDQINIVGKCSDTKPSLLGDFANPLLDESPVEKIIDTNRNNLSVTAIKSSVRPNSKFNLPDATTQDIHKLIDLLNPDKTSSSDSIPVRFIKLFVCKCN